MDAHSLARDPMGLLTQGLLLGTSLSTGGTIRTEEPTAQTGTARRAGKRRFIFFKFLFIYFKKKMLQYHFKEEIQKTAGCDGLYHMHISFFKFCSGVHF